MKTIVRLGLVLEFNNTVAVVIHLFIEGIKAVLESAKQPLCHSSLSLKRLHSVVHVFAPKACVLWRTNFSHHLPNDLRLRLINLSCRRLGRLNRELGRLSDLGRRLWLPLCTLGTSRLLNVLIGRFRFLTARRLLLGCRWLLLPRRLLNLSNSFDSLDDPFGSLLLDDLLYDSYLILCRITMQKLI